MLPPVEIEIMITSTMFSSFLLPPLRVVLQYVDSVMNSCGLLYAGIDAALNNLSGVVVCSVTFANPAVLMEMGGG